MLNSHMTQLTDQDASYLYLETPETPLHIGGVSLVELPEGYSGNFIDEYRAHIAERMHLNPLLHRKLVHLPFDIDHPFWVDDPAVDLNYHIRQQTLPAPGRIDQLEELVGRLHSNFLDRSRPLWEFYVINGLESGHVAIYTKIHHAALDGAASQQLIMTLYDPTPTPRQFPPAPPKAITEAPGLGGLLRGMAEHVVRQEIRAAQMLPELMRTVSHALLPDPDSLRYDPTALLPLAPIAPPKTMLNTAITSQRTYAMRTLQLSRVKRVAKQADVKVNDVVLALCAGALRRYLETHETVPKAALTAMVPVALNDGSGPATANNNAAMLCSLATNVADPLLRLKAIRESSGLQKRVLGNFRNLIVPNFGLVGSGLLMRGAIDLYRRAGLADKLPPAYNVVVSNVAGPPVPLYLRGAKVLSFNPCSIPFHGVALNITVESYCDSLDFGLIGCRRTVPGITELADHIVEALAELEAALATAAAAATAAATPQAAVKQVKALKAKAARPAKPAAHAKAKPVKAASPAGKKASVKAEATKAPVKAGAKKPSRKTVDAKPVVARRAKQSAAPRKALAAPIPTGPLLNRLQDAQEPVKASPEKPTPVA